MTQSIYIFHIASNYTSYSRQDPVCDPLLSVMAVYRTEGSLLHRILLLLLTISSFYTISLHQHNPDAKYNNNVTLLAMFSGNKLQVKFNKNIGFITPHKTQQFTKTRTLILIILAISGNVHSNPGPCKQNTTQKPRKQRKLRKGSNLPDWIYDLSQCSKRQLLKYKNLQRKCVSKEPHITYLQKYKTENITPPGLKLHKKPQIKKLKDKETWKNSLNDSSGKLIDILISQHQSDLETIKEQLETTKQELNTCNDVSDHLNLIDN